MNAEIDTALLDDVITNLHCIAGELSVQQIRVAEYPYGACAHEISQTLRALRIAIEAAKRTRNPEPLPTLEDVQAIYRQHQKPI